MMAGGSTSTPGNSHSATPHARGVTSDTTPWVGASPNVSRVSSVPNVVGRFYPTSGGRAEPGASRFFGGPRAPPHEGAYQAPFDTSPPVDTRQQMRDDEIASLVKRVQDREVALRRSMDDEHQRRMQTLTGARR